MDEDQLTERAHFCLSLVESASSIAMQGFASTGLRAPGRKGPQDFLTETDGAVELYLRERIAEAFPEDGFLGEETGGGGSSNLWVVDPIDGTANFARGIPHFCISIAFVAQGVTEIGMIAAPAMNEVYFARRGCGATRNGSSIHASDTSSYAAACIELGWSNRASEERYLRLMSGILGAGANVRRAASGALGLAYVADGRSDAYLELHMHAWDCLAGMLLAAEAGARISAIPVPLDGGKGGGPVLAAVPALANSLSEISGILLEDHSPIRVGAAGIGQLEDQKN